MGGGGVDDEVLALCALRAPLRVSSALSARLLPAPETPAPAETLAKSTINQTQRTQRTQRVRMPNEPVLNVCGFTYLSMKFRGRRSLFQTRVGGTCLLILISALAVLTALQHLGVGRGGGGRGVGGGTGVVRTPSRGPSSGTTFEISAKARGHDQDEARAKPNKHEPRASKAAETKASCKSRGMNETPCLVSI